MTKLFEARTTAGALGVITVLVTAMTGCQWRGANSLPIPGAAGGGAGSYSVQVQLPDVVNIQRNSRVRVADVTVGNVTDIELQGWHALVTLRLGGDVDLPANSTAKVGQTSLLGSVHIELAPPVDTPSEGRLKEGSLIPLSAGSSYPMTEQTLASVSVLLNGGGLGHLQDVNQTLATALDGREPDMRSLLTQLDTFIKHANDQTDDIINVTERFNKLIKQFADRAEVLENALDTIPPALVTLNDQRRTIADATQALGKFSAVAVATIDESGDALEANLRNIAPVLDALANSELALTRSLGQLATFPWPKDTLTNWMRGDYANVTLLLDLTKSRLDTGLFTGTRWEGDLTAWEIALGRTIGMQPSPATAGSPLTFPYHQDSY